MCTDVRMHTTQCARQVQCAYCASHCSYAQHERAYACMCACVRTRFLPVELQRRSSFLFVNIFLYLHYSYPLSNTNTHATLKNWQRLLLKRALCFKKTLLTSNQNSLRHQQQPNLVQTWKKKWWRVWGLDATFFAYKLKRKKSVRTREGCSD